MNNKAHMKKKGSNAYILESEVLESEVSPSFINYVRMNDESFQRLVVDIVLLGMGEADDLNFASLSLSQEVWSYSYH